MGGCGIEQVHPIPQHHAGSWSCFLRGGPLRGGRLLPLLCEWGLPGCLWLLHLLGSDRSISWPLPEAASAMVCLLFKPVAAGLWLQSASRQMPLNWWHCSRRLSGSLLGAAFLVGGQSLLQIQLQLLPAVIQAVLHLLYVRRKLFERTSNSKRHRKTCCDTEDSFQQQQTCRTWARALQAASATPMQMRGRSAAR